MMDIAHAVAFAIGVCAVVAGVVGIFWASRKQPSILRDVDDDWTYRNNDYL